MELKYHFNPVSGKRAMCEATVKECPLVHGSSPDEAMANYEVIMEKQNMLIAQVSAKTTNKTYIPPMYNRAPNARTPLKELSAEDLAETVESEAYSMGMDMKKIESSIALASELHANQKRGPRYFKGEYKHTSPYIEHPLRNALRLMRLGVEDDNLIAATILHDTVEDGAQEYAQNHLGKELDEVTARKELESHIRKEYGDETGDYVMAVTNEYVPKKKIQAMTLEQRHKDYREHVEENIKHSPGAYMVKISDFIDNATGLYHNDLPGQEKGTLKRAKKYLPVVDIFIKHMEKLDLPVSDDNKEVIRGQMDRTKVRLQEIIDKYTD